MGNVTADDHYLWSRGVYHSDMSSRRVSIQVQILTSVYNRLTSQRARINIVRRTGEQGRRWCEVVRTYKARVDKYSVCFDNTRH